MVVEAVDGVTKSSMNDLIITSRKARSPSESVRPPSIVMTMRGCDGSASSTNPSALRVASAGGGKKQITLDLADGEHKKVDIQCDSLVTLTGRIVELGTTTPVPGILVTATLGDNSDPGSISRRDNASDATGHSTIKNVPSGIVQLVGVVLNPSSDYDDVITSRRIDGSGTYDLGDIGVLKRRLKPGETEGELGVHWLEQSAGTPPEQKRYETRWIDPDGAAAKSELKLGDVVTTIDGIDVQGANHMRGQTLLTAPPGTKLALGLARGATATVVLRAP